MTQPKPISASRIQLAQHLLMKMIVALMNALFLLLTSFIFGGCGIFLGVLFSNAILVIKNPQTLYNYYVIAAMRILLCALIVFCSSRYLKRNKIPMFDKFSGLGLDARKTYLHTLIIGFAFGLIYLIPAGLDFYKGQ